MLRILRDKRTYGLVFVIVLVASVFWLLYAFYRFPRQSWVDGLLESWFLSKGLVMYRDFTNQYPPLLFIILMPFHKIFGFSQNPTMYLAPITSLGTLAVLAYVSFKWLKGWVKIIPIMFYAFWDPILSENHFMTTSFHSIINLLVFVVWWSWYAAPKKIKAFILGLLLSLSLLTMQIVVFFIALIFVSVLYRVLKDRKKVGDSHFFLVLLGFLLPCLLVIWWLFKTGAFPDFYYWNITYYFPGIYPFFAMGKGARDLRMYLAIISPILILAYVWFTKISRNGFFTQTFYAVVVAASLPATFWFAIFHPSRFYMMMPIFALIFGLGTNIFFKEKTKNKKIFALMMAGIVFFNLLVFIKDLTPIYAKFINHPREYQMLDRIYENDPIYQSIEWVKNNTPENSRLFVTETSLFYFASRRLPSSSRATMSLPWVFEPLSLFKEELIKNPPDYWVIDERNWIRFKNFGYQHIVDFFKKIITCDRPIIKFDYITITKHSGGSKFCF